MTSGEEPLAVTPIKDVGFPYQSFREFGEAGEAIDEPAMRFSWQRYMVASGATRAGSTPARPRCATATTAST
jgi:hypothetical protein